MGLVQRGWRAGTPEAVVRLRLERVSTHISLHRRRFFGFPAQGERARSVLLFTLWKTWYHVFIKYRGRPASLGRAELRSIAGLIYTTSPTVSRLAVVVTSSGRQGKEQDKRGLSSRTGCVLLSSLRCKYATPSGEFQVWYSLDNRQGVQTPSDVSTGKCRRDILPKPPLSVACAPLAFGVKSSGKFNPRGCAVLRVIKKRKSATHRNPCTLARMILL